MNKQNSCHFIWSQSSCECDLTGFDTYSPFYLACFSSSPSAEDRYKWRVVFRSLQMFDQHQVCLHLLVQSLASLWSWNGFKEPDFFFSAPFLTFHPFTRHSPADCVLSCLCLPAGSLNADLKVRSVPPALIHSAESTWLCGLMSTHILTFHSLTVF